MRSINGTFRTAVSGKGLVSILGMLLSMSLSQPIVAMPRHSGALPTLTTIRSIHNLGVKEAARAYPVHLKAVVTYYDPYLNPSHPPFIMVTDATGSIYVSTDVNDHLLLKSGVLVDITGKSEPGYFAPDIAHGHLRILGQSSLPLRPEKQTMTHLLTGSEDAQWVELEGVVKSVFESVENVSLKLALADGEMPATTVKEVGVDYSRLIDTKIRIDGLAGSLFNQHRQITGLQLLFPGMETVRVEQPAPQHPFQMPLSPIAGLMNYAPGNIFPHRVRIRGTVTLFWPGRFICIQDGTAALCAETAETTAIAVGKRADVIGFPQIGSVTPTLSDATYETETSEESVTPAAIDADQAFTGEHDAQLVQIEGRLIAHDRASQDPTIVLSSGKFTYSVILPKSADGRPLLKLEEGSLLRVSGVCSVQAEAGVFTRHNGYPVPKYFQIRLRSANDIVILQKPSWWTAARTLRVLALALAITVCILCWVVFLRLRLRQQTQLLGYQATHDGLTGLWNRKAILDFLQRELELAASARHSIGVIMIDADHFKEVNDTYGHLAGDSVLKELAHRIQQTVRTDDLTGRYGGEEFLVVLARCTGDEMHLVAERVRAAIAREPIHLDTFDLRMTVSVGTVVLDPVRNTQIEALAAADKALYQAKNAGRNRVVCGSLPAGASPRTARSGSPLQVGPLLYRLSNSLPLLAMGRDTS